MWKKKRYNLNIRLTQKELMALEWACGYFVPHIDYPEPRRNWEYRGELQKLYWRIHNKCVEINRG